MAGLNTNKLFCVVCKAPDLFPPVRWLVTSSLSSSFLVIQSKRFSSFQVMPKPVLTLLDLSFPLASSDLGAETLENEFILKNMHLSQVCLIFLKHMAIMPLIMEAIRLVSERFRRAAMLYNRQLTLFFFFIYVPADSTKN